MLQVDLMQVEPSIYLPQMLRDFELAGGKIVVRDFHTPAEVQALAEPVVFNCTGLGAGALFGDSELEPVRGQLVVLLPQPEVTYNLLAGRAYMFPRHDGIVLASVKPSFRSEVTLVCCSANALDASVPSASAMTRRAIIDRPRRTRCRANQEWPRRRPACGRGT